MILLVQLVPIRSLQKLLDTLNEVKTSSSSIDVALRESSEVKKKLLLEYEQYKTICSRAANLYIGINQIYLLPVHVFSSLYVKSISNGKVRSSGCFVSFLHLNTNYSFSAGFRSTSHLRTNCKIHV